MRPYSTDNGQRSVRKSGGTIIPAHRPDASQSPLPLDPWLLANRPPTAAPSRSSSSCVLGLETIRSRQRRHLLDFPPESQRPRKRSAKPFPQNSPWKAQTREPYRRRPVREYYGLRKK